MARVTQPPAPARGAQRSSILSGRSRTPAVARQPARAHIARYLQQVDAALRAIDARAVEDVIDELRDARARDATVFLFGNGGSAATASHFASDLAKGTARPGCQRFRVVALTDNVPLLTAWANDTDYGNVFVGQLEPLIRPGDLAIGISGSGSSQNVLRAAALARQRGARVIGLIGFDGGQLKALCDRAIVVPATRIEQVEDAHLVLEHAICTAIRGLDEPE